MTFATLDRMATTLRELLIQRAARLQERPALTTPDWGSLSYARFRSRVEGVALGLLAQGHPLGGVHSATGGPWDWLAEVAAAASGLTWDPAGSVIPPEILGGARFNDEAGRGPYHHQEGIVRGDTPFQDGLTQGLMMERLRKINLRLGWDHESRVDLPLGRLAEPALRAALWSALYAGAHAVLLAPASPGTRASRPLPGAPEPFNAEVFRNFWEPCG